MVVEWAWFLGIATAAVAIAVPVRHFSRGVALQNRCRAAWEGVVSELERRHGLLPDFIEAVRPAMRHERRLLLELAQARARARAAHGSPGERAAHERALVQAVDRVMAVAQEVPALREMQAFTRAAKELAIAEQRIQAARRVYNRHVRAYARLTQRLPATLFTPLYHWSPIAPFEAQAARVPAPAEASN